MGGFSIRPRFLMMDKTVKHGFLSGAMFGQTAYRIRDISFCDFYSTATRHQAIHGEDLTI
ncbi:MAG: hypothetical protein HFACDABA_00845 [Anaerolineales bacterium]|nr:hypothetical protein [Anaerolineales bacterium]